MLLALRRGGATKAKGELALYARVKRCCGNIAARLLAFIRREDVHSENDGYVRLCDKMMAQQCSAPARCANVRRETMLGDAVTSLCVSAQALYDNRALQYMLLLRNSARRVSSLRQRITICAVVG